METMSALTWASRGLDKQWRHTLVDHEAAWWVEPQKYVEFLMTMLASVTSLGTGLLRMQ